MLCGPARLAVADGMRAAPRLQPPEMKAPEMPLSLCWCALWDMNWKRTACCQQMPQARQKAKTHVVPALWSWRPSRGERQKKVKLKINQSHMRICDRCAIVETNGFKEMVSIRMGLWEMKGCDGASRLTRVGGMVQAGGDRIAWVCFCP